MSNETEGYWWRLLTFWVPDAASLLWLILSIMAVLFFQTLIHEGTHLIVDKSLGCDIECFVPFPHTNKEGKSWIGMVYLEGLREECSDYEKGDERKIATPQYVDIGLLIFLSLFLWLIPYCWKIQNRSVRLLFRMWYLGVFVDLFWNIIIMACSEGSDWYKLGKTLDYDCGTMIGFSLLILLIPLSFFAWGYFSKWHENPPESPQSGYWNWEKFKRGFWDYHWAAMAFAVLSTLAVVLLFAIDCPRVKSINTTLMVFQCISCTCYWVYLILFLILKVIL